MLKIEGSKEKISRRAGLLITNELIKKTLLEDIIDEEFGKPGSNRGIKASKYVTTIISMLHDGATHLEDVKHLETDQAYQELLAINGLPTSDAIGDWLRRQGSEKGEEKLQEVIKRLFSKVVEEEDVTLDIDATIIESEKGDAQKSYKGIRGYHPLLGVIEENGLVAASQFRQGNISPQSGLWPFIEECQSNYGKTIKYIRSDSAGFNKEVIENSMNNGKYFTITADHSTSVIRQIQSIPEQLWVKGREKDGIKAQWEVAETVYTLSAKKRSFRLVAKRVPIGRQGDFFTEYKYWIVATNLQQEQYSSNDVILFHHRRGTIERTIGELKNQFGLDHLPCGQYEANALYFTIGVLAYNILQMIKQIALPPEDRKKSVRTLRYQLIHLAGRIVYHARYMVLRLAAPKENIALLRNAFLRLRLSPA